MRYFLTIISFFLCSIISAQETDSLYSNSNPDSLSSPVKRADSTDSSKKWDVDEIVYANAKDSLKFDISNKKMYLFGKSDLKYGTTELTSGNIDIDFTKNQLDARGVIDSSDTTKTNYIDKPVLKEGEEVYEGTSLKYNFKTQRGFISMAKNEADDSRYTGEKVKKVDKNIYFVEDGIYTTCDADTPHTYFTSSQMKVMQGDKIVARWIFMHVGGVPIPVPLPFAVFPIQSGRRSGLIAPSYGQDASRGQYFRNFGYFWAINDYMDLTLTADYYFKGGYGLRSRFRYNERYDFNGELSGGFSRTILSEDTPNESDNFQWNINLFHHQDITPTAKIDANLQFMTNEYLNNNSVNLNDQIKQDIYSNATFTKRWESGNNLTINYNRTQNLGSGDLTELLPNVSFNKVQTYPFKKEGSSKRDESWYELIGYSYAGRFKLERKVFTIGSVADSTERDTTDFRTGFDHSVKINASPKIGYFNISPSISYNEKWYNEILQKTTVPNADSAKTGRPLKTKDTISEELNAVRTFNFALTARTRIFGMAQPGVLGIKAFRHTLEPSITYSLRPDFSSDFWGYYDSYINEYGEEVKYDKFGRNIFSGTGSAGQQQNLSYSIGNIFEIKTEKDPTDTTSQEEKIRLLNWNVTQSYNFAADSIRLSDLSMRFRTQVGELLNLQASTTHTFYDYVKDETGRTNRVDQFLVSNGKGLARMTNFTLNISTSLSGDKISGENRDGRQTGGQMPGDDRISSFEKSDYIQMFDDLDPDFSIPWNLSLNYNYSYSHRDPFSDKTVSQSIGINAGFSLTQNWKFTARLNYDIERDEITAPQITIYRDLHCWEMNFTWNPIGNYSGFRFEIRLKAQQLQDLKLTKSEGRYSGF
jgi:lipopolysaccharide assembly outer membrane protein LptD (OstA)